MHFEVEGFIEAAKKAGWKRKTIFDNLFYNSDQSDELKNKLNNILNKLVGE